MDNIGKAKAIISKIRYITLATVAQDGKPWNAPVFSAYDENYNFYWGSHRESQHSKNIRAAGHVFLVIYDSTVAAGQGEGVYIEAAAAALEDPEKIMHAHQLLEVRHQPASYWKLEQVQGSAPIRLYKAVPEKVWMNGEGEVNGHYIDTRVEVGLLS